MKRLLFGLVAVVLLTACGSTGAAPHAAKTAASTHDVTVTVAFGLRVSERANGAADDGIGCGPGYTTQVTLTDQSGTVLGQAQISPGITQGKWIASEWRCPVTVDLGQVPNAAQYGVVVHDDQSPSAPSPIYFSASEAAANGYNLGVTLGS